MWLGKAARPFISGLSLALSLISVTKLLSSLVVCRAVSKFSKTTCMPQFVRHPSPGGIAHWSGFQAPPTVHSAELLVATPM